jgi:hypothetical protein
MGTVRSSLVASFLATLSIAAAGGAATAEPVAPLEDRWVQAFRAVEPDPHPDELANNSHFLVSDERRHDLFEPSIRGLGGALVGVGPEQNYLMAGWQRAELVVLYDFDQMVVDLHDIYALFFAEAASAEALLALWSKDSVDRAEALIASRAPSEARKERLLKVYRLAKRYVPRKLAMIRDAYAKRGVQSLFDDPTQYAHVRALVAAGRVIPIRADLTGTKAFVQFGKVLRDMGMPVRVLYLSNAERYFDWVPSFRDNMRALPYDDRSVVLRTAGWGEPLAAEDDPLYLYQVQRADNLLAWLDVPGIQNAKPIISRRKAMGPQGLYTIEKWPKGKGPAPETQEK